jgi:DNA-binding IclR family transcriptional regulator
MAHETPVNQGSQANSTASSHTRLIEVIDALVLRAGAEPWGVRELAAELGESRSTVNRILLTLVEQGFALEAGAGKYSVGPRVSVLTNALIARSVLLQTCNASLADLADSTNATALVSIYSPGTGGYFVAACSEPKASLTFRPEMGAMHPLSFGGIGRQLAAFLGVEELIQSGPLNVSDSSEYEFPEPLSVAVRRLKSGLLIAISVHSADGKPTHNAELFNDGVLSFSDELVKMIDETLCKREVSEPIVSLENTKSTASRLERLLLIACALPQGVKNTVGLHDQLLCNAATAKRLVQSGIQSGIVVSIGSMLYPGPKLFQWASRLGFRQNIADLTRSTVHGLVQETGETIAILAFDEELKRAEFLDVIQGWRPIQYQLSVNTDVPLYAGAAGKAVLAFCDRQTIDSIELIKLTEATITDRVELNADLEVIAQRGWATGTGERVLGAFGLAVPFFVDGKIRGSISATIPQYRKDDRDLPKLTQLMQEATRKIGRLLSLGVSL